MSGWRSLVCTEYDEFALNNGLIVMKKGDKECTLPIEQLRDLMIVAASSTISVPLLVALTEANANVIFCDKRYRPVAQLCGLNQNTSASGRLQQQIEWAQTNKDVVWSHIVHEKLLMQQKLLFHKEHPSANQIAVYGDAILPGDTTNREGQAARVYFHALFGKDFRRHAEDATNAALNYGYTILLTMMTRLVVLHGYNTSLGIHHCNPGNPFNLSCDLVEPFRPFVDQIAAANPDRELDWEYKKLYVSLLQASCRYRGNVMKLETAMDMFLLDIMQMIDKPFKLAGEIDFE